jgi:hypothetical protein
MTKEHRKKIGNSNKGKIISAEQRKILSEYRSHKIMTPYGNFNSIKEASKHIGKGYNSIIKMIKLYPNEWYYL